MNYSSAFEDHFSIIKYSIGLQLQVLFFDGLGFFLNSYHVYCKSKSLNSNGKKCPLERIVRGQVCQICSGCSM